MSYTDITLTDTVLRTSKPLDKPFKLYDEAGLFIQVIPSGGEWWRFKYRFDGKEKLLSFGTFPDVTLLSARQRRDLARKLLASDTPIDPSKKRKDEKAEKLANKTNTFELWAGKWWQHWQTSKSPRHALCVNLNLARRN